MRNITTSHGLLPPLPQKRGQTCETTRSWVFKRIKKSPEDNPSHYHPDRGRKIHSAHVRFHTYSPHIPHPRCEEHYPSDQITPTPQNIHNLKRCSHSPSANNRTRLSRTPQIQVTLEIHQVAPQGPPRDSVLPHELHPRYRSLTQPHHRPVFKDHLRYSYSRNQTQKHHYSQRSAETLLWLD